MKSAEYMNIITVMDYINKEFGRSYASIKDLKLTGRLDYIYSTRDVDRNFEIILRDFLDKLDAVGFNQYPFTRQISLYNFNDLIECYNRYYYDLGAYLNKNIILTPQNNKIWLSFPRFIKAACIKYNIEPYASMTEEALHYKVGGYLKLNAGISTTMHADGTHDEYEVSVEGYTKRFHNKYIKYNEYKKNNLPFSYMTDDESIEFMSVDAEKRSFDYFNSQQYGQTYWVANVFGDGYGYDIMFYNPNGGEENLIEVKSSRRNEYFDLSENEFNIMMTTERLSNSNYYIMKYLYGRSVNECTCKSYKYDKQRHMLVDASDPSIVCEIEKCEKKDEHDNIVTYYRCTPKKLENIKTLINKM